jgi:hypothetical protein
MVNFTFDEASVERTLRRAGVVSYSHRNGV